MKELFLLRGLPGSGKSTLANSLGGKWFEADKYFVNSEGTYEFDAAKLEDAHKWCRSNVEDTMKLYENLKDDLKNVPNRIVVSNTFTKQWEMSDYYELAKKYEYRVYSLIVENRHNGINQHGVPLEKLEQMRNRFEIKL
jgi:predicted kinase